MSLTENSDQVFLPGGCNRTQNLRFGPYTIMHGKLSLAAVIQIYVIHEAMNGCKNLRFITGFCKQYLILKKSVQFAM